jgi:hypothetical protein
MEHLCFALNNETVQQLSQVRASLHTSALAVFPFDSELRRHQLQTERYAIYTLVTDRAPDWAFLAGARVLYFSSHVVAVFTWRNNLRSGIWKATHNKSVADLFSVSLLQMELYHTHRPVRTSRRCAASWPIITSPASRSNKMAAR